MNYVSAVHKQYSIEPADAPAARSDPHSRRSKTPEKLSGPVPKPRKRQLGQPQPSKNRALDFQNSMTLIAQYLVYQANSKLEAAVEALKIVGLKAHQD